MQPSTLSPQLAVLVEQAPTGEDWLHEIKFDGYRLLAFVEKGKARLLTRNGKDWSNRFPGLIEALEELDLKQAVLDGEAVALDANGRSDFQSLQNAMKHPSTVQPVYYAFDLPYFDDRDLRQEPLLERKRILKSILPEGSKGLVRFSDHIQGQGSAFFEEACKKGLEGMISKKADSAYVSSRSRNWRKVKCERRQEFVIAGFTDPKGSRVGFGALLLGYYDDGDLIYCGRVGTGFDNDQLRELNQRLAKMERKTSPLKTEMSGQELEGVHWVTPKLVGEVRFTEWTDDGRLRHPAFLSLREDKPAPEVRKE